MFLSIDSNFKVHVSRIKLEYIPNIRQSHYKPKQELCFDSTNNSWIFQLETDFRDFLRFLTNLTS